MRILIVGPVPPPYGGMALQAQALLERLRHDRIEADLIATNPPIPRFVAAIKGVRTLVQSAVFLGSLARALRRPAVVHLLGASHWYFGLRVIPCLLFAKVFGRRTILNYRGGEAPRFFRRYRPLALPALRLADEIVVPSEYLQRTFNGHGIDVKIIPNFVDLGRFRFRPRERLRPKLLVTRTLEPLYNVQMALEAFAIVKRNYPDAELDIVGGGSQEVVLKGWVRGQGLAGVRFHGAVPNADMPKYLASADLLLNPSNADNMPITLLEAFAAGVPVVTTDVGGIPDLVGACEAALMVKPNDAMEMAARIDELLQDPEKAAQIVRNAKSLSDRMSWARVGPLWHELYRAGDHDNYGDEVVRSANQTGKEIRRAKPQRLPSSDV